MRLLFAIPHFFGYSAVPNYGSERTEREERARVTRRCLASLQQTFGEAQALLDGRIGGFHPANPLLRATLTISVCTTGDSHLVPELQGCDFEHVATDAEPRHLGFECHKVLRSGL